MTVKTRGMAGLAFLVMVTLTVSSWPVAAQQQRRERGGRPSPQEAGVIQGRVLDAETGKPLVGASVMVAGTSLAVATGAIGRYVIGEVPPGHYEITASMMGYEAADARTEVRPGEATAVDFELHWKPIEMGGIVVTGTRTPRYVKDVPVRTEVITSQRIEEKGAPDLYGALQGLPGIRIEQRCSACNYSVVRMQGLESGHTQVLIDGQPIYSNLAAVYGLQQIPTNNIERIEVVKGAASALYGSAAIAGVINVITKSPTDEPRVDMTSSFGTAGTDAQSMIASRRLGDVGVVLTAQKNTGDGIDEDGDGLSDRVETNNLALGVKLDWDEVVGGDRLSLRGRTVDETRRGGDMATWENAFASSAEHIQTARVEAGLQYRKTVPAIGTLTFDLSHASHDRSATNDAFRSDYEAVHGSPPSLDEMIPYRAEEGTWVLDANVSGSIANNHNVLGGFQYSRNELNETGKYVSVDPSDPGYGHPYVSHTRKHARDVGFYVQDELTVHDAVEVVLGARLDIHSSEDEFGGSGKVAPKESLRLHYDEQAFSPRLALRFSVSENLILRGSVGTGFRVPYGFSEEMHLCSGSPRVYKPRDLRPESSTSFNVSGEYRTKKLIVDGNVFRTDLRDKIGFTSASEGAKRLGYTYEWENIADAHTQGLELGLKADLGRHLQVDLNATFTDARYDGARTSWVETHPEFAQESQYLPRVPRVTSGVSITFTPGDWTLNLGVEQTGSMYIEYFEDQDLGNPGSKIVRTPPFAVADCQMKRLLWNGISVFGGAHNLFDYVQKERHPDDPAFIYAPYTGRILYGGVRVMLH